MQCVIIKKSFLYFLIYTSPPHFTKRMHSLRGIIRRPLVRYLGIRPPRPRRERSDAVDEVTREDRLDHSKRISELNMEEKVLVPIVERLKTVREAL